MVNPQLHFTANPRRRAGEALERVGDTAIGRVLHRYDTELDLLDVNLGAETSLPVARRLSALGVPFAFATGYGESFRIPPELGAVPLMKKPYTADTLRQALAVGRA